MRIGEVSKLLDIPVQTIRFYEKQGIISPERTGDGAYREYEPWDLFYLIECLTYRNIGLTVNETKKVLHQEPLSYLSDCVKRRLVQLKEQRAIELLMEKHLIEYERKIEVLHYNIGKFWITKQPEMAVMPNLERHGSQYQYIEKYNKVFAKWIKNMPFVQSMQIISLNDLCDEHAPDHDIWAAAVEKDLMPVLHLRMEEGIQVIPEEVCVTTICDAGERGQLSIEKYRNVIKQVEMQGYKPSGNIRSHLLARCWEDGTYHRYFEVFVPIEK